MSARGYTRLLFMTCEMCGTRCSEGARTVRLAELTGKKHGFVRMRVDRADNGPPLYSSYCQECAKAKQGAKW